MTQERDTSEAERSYPGSFSRVLVYVILASGLALPSVLGLIVVFGHRAEGISTVDFRSGLELIVPLTVLLFIPFAVLAAITRHVASRIPAKERNAWFTWNLVASGALVGLIITVGNFAIEPMRYTGPGGVEEALGMMMALWVFTLPLLLFWSVVGIFLGGVVGLIVSVIWTLFQST